MARFVDLESVRLLVAIGDHGSISAGARAVGISQPAATARIRELEARYRVTLIQRSAQGSRLTEDGQAVCAWSRSVLHEAATLEAGISALGSRDHDNLHVAASLTVAEYLMPSWLAEMHRSNPHVQVSLSVVNSVRVLDAVRSGDVTVGFVEVPGNLGAVSEAVVGHDRLLVVVPPTHRWATSRHPLSRDELLTEAFVLREEGSGTRDTFQRRLRAVPDVAVVANSTGTVIASTKAGVGPAVLSSLAVAEAIRSGSLVEVAVQVDLRRPLKAVWQGGRRLRSPASDLVSIARQHHLTHDDEATSHD